MSSIEPPSIWLNVDGAPRSGTTALLNLLNRCQDIFIFHELVEHDLKQAFDQIHVLTARLRSYKNVGEHVKHLLREDDSGRMLLSFLAYSASGGTPRIVGTKDPERVIHPDVPIATSLIRKTVHLTRDPISVLHSAIKRIDAAEAGLDWDISNKAEGLTRIAALWIRYWESALLSIGSMDFLHLFYEDIGCDRADISGRVGHFLGVNDFMVDGWSMPKHDPNRRDRMIDEIAKRDESIATIFASVDWRDRHRLLAQRNRIAMPYTQGEWVNFCLDGNAWYFASSGFGTPDETGSWLNAEVGTLIFCGLEDGCEYYLDIELRGVGFIVGMTHYNITVECRNSVTSSRVDPETISVRARIKIAVNGAYAASSHIVELFIRAIGVDISGETVDLQERFDRIKIHSLKLSVMC